MNEFLNDDKLGEVKTVVETLKGKSFRKSGKVAIDLQTQEAGETKTVATYTSDRLKETLKSELPALVREAQAYRKGIHSNCIDKQAEDLDLAEVIEQRYGFARENNGSMSASYLEALGVSYNMNVESFVTFAEQDPELRWLIPEVFLDQVRLGVRAGGIYRELISAEIPVAQRNVTIPAVNMSDAMAKFVEEGETIQLGTVSFGSKQVKIRKMGRGISMTDEAMRYCSLNMLGIFLEDFGVRYNQGMDVMAVQTLIDGDQLDGSDSTAVIGVGTAGTMAYRDLLRVWMRTSQMGTPTVAMITEEALAMDIFELEEFKLPRQQGTNGTNPSNLGAPTLNIRNLVPPSQNFYIHGVIDPGQILMVSAGALLKLNAVPLSVEEKRDAAKQITEYYITLTTGFATAHRERRIIVDKSLPFSSNGFPSYFDIKSYQRNSVIR